MLKVTLAYPSFFQHDATFLLSTVGKGRILWLKINQLRKITAVTNQSKNLEKKCNEKFVPSAEKKILNFEVTFRVRHIIHLRKTLRKTYAVITGEELIDTKCPSAALQFDQKAPNAPWLQAEGSRCLPAGSSGTRDTPISETDGQRFLLTCLFEASHAGFLKLNIFIKA